MKVGIVGAAMVVPSFLEAAALVEQMEIYALYARKADVRQELCEKYQIPVQYDSYEKLLADPQVDVVYITLPNYLHFPFAKEALEAGKHVIMEKPFTVTYAEAEELANLARLKKLYLFEAVSILFNPNYLKMREMLPLLGEIKIAETNFSQYSSRYDDFKKGIVKPVFNPEMGGGALLDLNVYNLHLIAGLFGKPKSVQYFPNMERGIDTSGTVVMQYENFVATCTGAKDCKAPARTCIEGTKGCIFTQSPPIWFLDISYQENKSEPVQYELADSPQRLYYELKAFADYYTAKDEMAFERCLQHSLTVMEIIDMARGVGKKDAEPI